MRASHDPPCSSSSSRAATSPTSSTAACATWRPRTSRTSSASAPSRQPGRSDELVSLVRQLLDGVVRRPPGAYWKRSARTPAACSTCSSAGPVRSRCSRPRRANRRTPWSRRGRRRRTPARPQACAPRPCATRWADRRSALPRRRRSPARPRRAGRPRASARPRPLRRRPRPRPPASSWTWPGRQPRRGLARAQHRALGKGLEWRAVHVLALYDGNFPSDLSAGDQRRSRRSVGCSTSPSPAPMATCTSRPRALLPPARAESSTATATGKPRASHRGGPVAVGRRPHGTRRRPRRRGTGRGRDRVIEVSVDALFR